MFKKMLASLLAVAMIGSVGVSVSASEVGGSEVGGSEVGASGVAPYGAIYQTTFPGAIRGFETSADIYVQAYGSSVGKVVGKVVFRGTVTNDEIWEVNASGSKLNFVGYTNYRFISAYPDYSLKAFTTVSDTSFSISSDGSVATARGFATWSGIDGIPFSDDYEVSAFARYV